jgi:hypothetical protein
VVRIKIVQSVLLAAPLLWAGCGGRNVSPASMRMACETDTAVAAAMQAAQDVLTDMHFPIEKLDCQQGIIRTAPLRGAQFFEFWRRDNASAFDTAEANLQSIRRSVEIRVGKMGAEHGPQTADTPGLQSPKGDLRIDCDVQVQRLSLPENEIASISQAYRIHTRSDAAMLRLDVSPQQQEGMAWMDLGQDRRLATEILKRIVDKLKNPKERKAK